MYVYVIYYVKERLGGKGRTAVDVGDRSECECESQDVLRGGPFDNRGGGGGGVEENVPEHFIYFFQEQRNFFYLTRSEKQFFFFIQ